MRNASFGLASWDSPAWLRRRWSRAVRENDLNILTLLVDFVRRATNGELFWR